MARITREKLRGYIGKDVIVRLFDGSEYAGILRDASDEKFKAGGDYPYRPGYYFIAESTSSGIVNYMFRVSHVSKIKMRWE